MGKLIPDQRLAVAGRLAALMLFAGRTAILQGFPADQIDGDLSSQEALGGTEEENGQTVEITPEAIRETLDTGLFTARGPARLGWAHQTYAEFLAARYVIRHSFDNEQILSLITHPGYSSRLVIPQLVQTTACLVNMKPSLFEELVQDSPHVLLRSEASAWDSRQKFVLTAAFLKLVAELKLTDRDSELWRSFSKLKHPDLANQLDPYIRDCPANPVVRRVAIGIAEASRAIELRQALLGVALDISDNQPTRVQAIRALSKIGDNDTRQRLLSLLDSDLHEDDDDQIRGAILSQVWPDLLSFEKLTGYLTQPKSESFLGAYWAFLKYELAKNLRVADLPQALAWARAQEGGYYPISPISEAADSILREGCRHIENPTVIAPLIAVIMNRLEDHRALWEEGRFNEPEDNPLQDTHKRHLLLLGLVMHASDAQALSNLHVVRRLREDDFPWLLQQLLTATTEAEQRKWSILAQELFFTDINRYWTPVLEGALQNKALAQDLLFLIGPIDLDSPMAERQRKEWQSSQRLPAEGKEATDRVASSLQQVDLILQENGDRERGVWWQLDGLLADLRKGELNADLRKFGVWQSLDEERRARVVTEAQSHIITGEDPGDGSMSGNFNSHELASFRALYLASAETPDFCIRLSQDVVQKWTMIILKKPGLVDDKAEPYIKLLRLALQKALDLVLEKISQAIEEQNQKADSNGRPHLDMQIEVCWSDRLESLLVEKLKSAELKPGFSAYLMELLLAKGSEQAQRWGLEWIKKPIPNGLEDQEKQLRVALSLLFVEGDCWILVWNRITALAALEDTLTQQTVDHLYYEFDHGPLKNLAGSRLASVCFWVKQTFAESTRSRVPRPRTRMPRGIAEIFQGNLFTYLQRAGTPEALETLQRLARLLPDDSGIKWMLAEAHQASLQRSWIPPEPATILQMARRPDSRLVDSGERLLEIIVESLERLQRKFHGHDPFVELLWNKWEDDKGGIHWRPKDEGSLSIVVKSHLEEDLRGGAIVLNREVEIRRTLGKGIRQGQETDIQVDAIARHHRSGEPQRISVIIEAKGCWNRKLKDAMKEQLVDRYLAESDCPHGIYLVGWFLCDAWDKEDYRKDDTPKWALQQAREHFQKQAAEASRGDFLIRSFVLDAELR